MGVTGAGLTAVKYWSNEGKTARWNRDLWDRVSRLSFATNRTSLANLHAAKYVTFPTSTYQLNPPLARIACLVHANTRSYMEANRSCPNPQ